MDVVAPDVDDSRSTSFASASQRVVASATLHELATTNPFSTASPHNELSATDVGQPLTQTNYTDMRTQGAGMGALEICAHTHSSPFANTTGSHMAVRNHTLSFSSSSGASESAGARARFAFDNSSLDTDEGSQQEPMLFARAVGLINGVLCMRVP